MATAPGADEPVELVSIQVVGQGVREGAGVPDRIAVEPGRARARSAAPRLLRRRARLDRDADPAPLRSRASAAAGPLIVEEYDATCVVPPGATAELDKAGSILIALDA